jgi:hypothetical protein
MPLVPTTRLHLQSFVHSSLNEGWRQAGGWSQKQLPDHYHNMMKNMLYRPTLLSEIRVGKRRRNLILDAHSHDYLVQSKQL